MLKKLKHKIEICSVYGKGTRVKIIIEDIVKRQLNPMHISIDLNVISASDKSNENMNLCVLNEPNSNRLSKNNNLLQ